jgi:hypothetical protein
MSIESLVNLFNTTQVKEKKNWELQVYYHLKW